MCHETTSVALPQSIGVPVGTVTLDDFAQTDCILFFGQNPGSNSPRMLHPLQEARKRGVPIITFNPLRERGLERFTNPQSPVEMLTGHETRISSQYHQVKAGGDLAALTGHLQGAGRAGRRAGSGEPPCSTTPSSPSTRTGSRASCLAARAGLGRARARVRPARAALEATARIYAAPRRASASTAWG